MSRWIYFNGSDCPVDPEEYVEYYVKDLKDNRVRIAKAGDVFWGLSLKFEAMTIQYPNVGKYRLITRADYLSRKMMNL